jgi:hypothetical protein
MPIPAAAILTILAGTSKSLLEVPLIHRWVENFLDGLGMTFWDALLWHGLAEKVWGVKSPEEKQAVVLARAGDVQVKYDEVKTVMKREAISENEAIEKVTGINPFSPPWMEN